MNELVYKCIPVGFGNMIMAHRIIGIAHAESAPMRRLRQEAKSSGRLIDLTEGRKTRSIILLDTNHVVLSATQVETLEGRLLSSTLMEDAETADENEEDEGL